MLLAIGTGGLIYYKVHTNRSNISVKDQPDIDATDTPGVAKESQRLEIKEDNTPISFEAIVPSIRLLLNNLKADLPFFESNYLRRYCEHGYPDLQNLTVYFEMHIRNITDELKENKEDLNHVFNFFLFSLKLITS